MFVVSCDIVFCFCPMYCLFMSCGTVCCCPCIVSCRPMILFVVVLCTVCV